MSSSSNFSLIVLFISSEYEIVLSSSTEMFRADLLICSFHASGIIRFICVYPVGNAMRYCSLVMVFFN